MAWQTQKMTKNHHLSVIKVFHMNLVKSLCSNFVLNIFFLPICVIFLLTSIGDIRVIPWLAGLLLFQMLHNQDWQSFIDVSKHIVKRKPLSYMPSYLMILSHRVRDGQSPQSNINIAFYISALLKLYKSLFYPVYQYQIGMCVWILSTVRSLKLG